MAQGSTTKTLVWILMAMLILGLGGFGVTNLSGNIRSIGSVGGKDIDVNAYARALQEDIRALEAQTQQSIPFSMAQQLGVDRQVLGRLVALRALDAESDRLGLSIGDENLRREILNMDAFKDPTGAFSRETYRLTLEQAGLNEAQFEETLREEAVRGILQGAVVNGSGLPKTYVDTIIAYLAETRDFTWARLTGENLTAPLSVPSDEDLAAYHAENAARFTLPEKKRLTYAWVTPEMILDEVEVEEATLRALYDERVDQYVQAERRLVERLAFADAEAAAAAKAAIDAGDTSFEDAVAARGLDLSDIDLGDVGQPELDAAGDAVFGAEVGSVVGPFDGPVGPALFRVNGKLPARSTGFEDARPELHNELASDRARRLIDGKIDVIDDLLAGGATLEELTDEAGLEVSTLDWSSDVSDSIAAYDAFREAAAQVGTEDFPEIIQLEDGGIFALRLDEVLPPREQTLDEVRDQVVAGWQDRETVERLKAQTQTLLPQLQTTASFAQLLGASENTETGIIRNGFVPGTPADFLKQVFEMSEGDMTLIEAPNSLLLVRLDAVHAADMTSADVRAAQSTLTSQAASGISNDLYAAFANAIRARVDTILDQHAINAVHANFQ